jgi:hypothetical protein
MPLIKPRYGYEFLKRQPSWQGTVNHCGKPPIVSLGLFECLTACENGRFDLARPRPSAGMGLTIDHSRGTEGRHEPPVASGMFIAGF